MDKRQSIAFILFTIFIDSVGFGIIVPVMPQLVMHVGNLSLDGAISVGAWTGFGMALASFFAAPVLGNLSDRYGRRAVLIPALGGLAVSYGLLSIANTLPLLVGARIISGIFGGSYGAAQAAIADITPPEQRAARFGLVGAAFGVGFVLGPVIGGLAGMYSTRAPFVIAAAMAAINLIYGIFIFPETLPHDRRRSFSWARANPFGALRSARAIPGMGAVMLVLVSWQIASLVYPMTWNWYGIAKFGWSSTMIGISLAAVGVITALSQTLITGRAVKRLGERRAASVGLVGATMLFIGYAFITETWQAFALMLGMGVSSLVQPSLMALASQAAPADAQGEAQGIAGMAMGLGTLLAPLLLTETLAHFTKPGTAYHFPGAAFLVAAVFSLISLALLRKLGRPRAG